MFSRSQFIAGLFALALVLGGLAYRSTEASALRDDAALEPQAPTLQLDASSNTITVCPTNPAQASQVALAARAVSPQNNPIRYKWTSTGGRIVGDGPNTTWDFTGVQPGTYRATVEVNSGRELDCTAFTSTLVVVRACPPPVCPNITIYCPENVTLGQPLTFNANVGGITGNITPVYNWTVSAGTIVSGQGTPTIQVDTTGLGGQSVRASLDVGGFNLACSASCAAMIQVPVEIKPKKFDEFPDIARDDEKARLDNYAIELQNSPDSKGYMIVYPGRRTKTGIAQARADRMMNYLTRVRGIGQNRLVTMTGPTRDNLTIELWLVPTGATPPTPR